MVREKIVVGDDEWLCMCAYVEHRRVETQQVQEKIGGTMLDHIRCELIAKWVSWETPVGTFT